MLHPTSNFIILQEIKEEEKKSGIIIPGAVEKDMANRAKVLAIGKDAETEVKVDDVVIFRKFVPEEVLLGKEKFLVITAKDIMAIIK